MAGRLQQRACRSPEAGVIIDDQDSAPHPGDRLTGARACVQGYPCVRADLSRLALMWDGLPARSVASMLARRLTVPRPPLRLACATALLAAVTAGCGGAPPGKARAPAPPKGPGLPRA